VSTAIAKLTLRVILDSRAEWTVEADVVLEDGDTGRGSAPVAIAPGRRERARSTLREGIGLPLIGVVRGALTDRAFAGQAAFDAALEELAADSGIGANVTLALSLAFCRATCQRDDVALYRRLADLAGTTPSMPHPLVNIFSGGVHMAGAAHGFQQIMVVPERPTIREDVNLALVAFTAVEDWLSERGVSRRLSASSGMVVTGARDEELLAQLQVIAAQLSEGHRPLGLAVDVAAEHLCDDGGCYRLGDRLLAGSALLEHLDWLVEEVGLVYVEDPFDPSDEALWRAFTTRHGDELCIVGDDLFGTDTRYLDASLANAILLKPSQVGTVTRTLEAAAAARAAGMSLCVSHRSGETEDTAICDLAVAVGARYAKVGGPRRGDRIAKYNQLLRLADELDDAALSAQPNLQTTTVEG
jgi:enolase